jgi:hypothetical protein
MLPFTANYIERLLLDLPELTEYDLLKLQMLVDLGKSNVFVQFKISTASLKAGLE